MADINRDSEDKRTGSGAGDPADGPTPLLDRSRSQLRLPLDLVDETLRIAQRQSIPDLDPESGPDRPSDETVERLASSGIMVDGRLDAVAFELLDVVNHASLEVEIELSYLEDSSTPVLWATPRRAVVSSSLDPHYMEIRPVPISQLPQVLAQLIVMRSPSFIGDVPISIEAQVLSKVEQPGVDREASLDLLTESGLDVDQAVLVNDLQRGDARRWRISSRWSTEDGPLTETLSGVDAGPSGQWLLVDEQSEDGEALMSFVPQGHGETMSAFRNVLPRNWMGTPLNPPPA